jgi:hypothetical protein
MVLNTLSVTICNFGCYNMTILRSIGKVRTEETLEHLCYSLPKILH